jgi:hypothetical protein
VPSAGPPPPRFNRSTGTVLRLQRVAERGRIQLARESDSIKASKRAIPGDPGHLWQQGEPLRSRFQRRRMFFHLRQSRIETRPFRRGFGPDGCGRGRQIRIVKRSSAHKDKCRPLFRLAEHSCPAPGAKTPVHGRPAISLGYVIGERTGNVEVLRAEEGAGRPGSSAEILADAAPAIACAERRLRSDLVAHRLAQTSPP